MSLQDLMILNEKIEELEEKIQERDQLIIEALPMIDSYHRSRSGSDWKNGKSEERAIWLDKAKKLVGEK